MEILCFKIRGKFAHFRKYYANNTAFSFTIPPRTSLMGIVAASMGWPKDSYYNKLSSNNIFFGVRVLQPLKKSFHRLNFLSIKSTGDLAKNFSSDFRGDGGRIQTPFETVSGLNLAKDEVAYQVFLGYSEKGMPIFDQIKNHFLHEQPVFNITMGTANFQASLYGIEIIESNDVEQKNSDDYVHLHSAVPVAQVESLEFDKDAYEQYNFVEEDMLPGEFVSDGNREVKSMNRLLFSTTKLPLRVKINTGFWEVKTSTETLNIQFMDQ
jgi:CRISPR-associated protein Cas5h